MSEQGNFKCLRCGLDFTESYDPKHEPQERSCPKCRSNSIRLIKEKRAKLNQRHPVEAASEQTLAKTS